MTLGARFLLADPQFSVLLLAAMWGAGFFLALRLHRSTSARLSRAGWLMAFALFCVGFVVSTNLFLLFAQAILGGWLIGVFGLFFVTNFALAYLYGIASAARSVDAQGDTKLAFWGALPVGNLHLLIPPTMGARKVARPTIRGTGFVMLAVLALAAILPLNALRSDLAHRLKSGENSSEVFAASVDALGIEWTLQDIAKRTMPGHLADGVKRTHASAEGHVLTRWYEVDRALVVTDLSLFETKLRDEACRSPQVGILLVRGAVFRNDYHIIGDDAHVNVSVARGDCEN